jgi:stage V sporulation protein G
MSHLAPSVISESALVITEVKITLMDDGALRAFATITFNDSFVVHGLKVIERTKGRFVAMPSRARRDGTHQDVAHPVTRKFRAYMEAAVLAAYDAALAEADGYGASGDSDEGE